MINKPSRRNSLSPKPPQPGTELGWGLALRFIETKFGLRGKTHYNVDKKFPRSQEQQSPLGAEASSQEIALHLLRTYRVRQAVEETLKELVYLINDLNSAGTSTAHQALCGLRQGAVGDAVSYYRQYAELNITAGNDACRVASDYFVNESVLTFLSSQAVALKVGMLATDADPSHSRAWEVYGTLQMCCGQFTAAEQSFARAQTL